MASEIPTFMKAVVYDEVLSSVLPKPFCSTEPSAQNLQVAVREHPVPNISDDDVLVKTVAISLNPTDYKRKSCPDRDPYEA